MQTERPRVQAELHGEWRRRDARRCRHARRRRRASRSCGSSPKLRAAEPQRRPRRATPRRTEPTTCFFLWNADESLQRDRDAAQNAAQDLARRTASHDVTLTVSKGLMAWGAGGLAASDWPALLKSSFCIKNIHMHSRADTRLLLTRVVKNKTRSTGRGRVTGYALSLRLRWSLVGWCHCPALVQRGSRHVARRAWPLGSQTLPRGPSSHPSALLVRFSREVQVVRRRIIARRQPAR